MAKKVLSIELGERLTRVCVSAKQRKNTKVLTSFYFQTPEGAVQDGHIAVAEPLARELKQQMTKHGIIDLKEVTFTIASSRIVSREVQLPLVKENRLKSIVQTNAAEYFPIDLSGYEIAHALLETTTGEHAASRVLITVAPKQLLEEYISFAKVAGLSVEALDHVSNSQYNLFKRASLSGVTMYLAIAPKQTLATFMRDNVMLLQRTFPFGGDELISSAMQSAEMDDTQFTEALGLCADEKWLRTFVSQERCEEILNRLANGVVRSADFFKSAHKGAQIDRVVLLDACANLVGLRDAVADAIGVEVVPLQYLPSMGQIGGDVNTSTYAACIGSSFQPLSLMPTIQEEGKKRPFSSQFSQSMFLPVTVLVLGVVGGLGTAGFSLMEYVTAQAEFNAMQARYNDLAYAEEAYHAYVEYEAVKGNFEILEGESNNYNAQLHAFLEEIEVKMPSNLLLLSASCDDTGVSMNVQVETMEEAAVVLSQFRTFESLDQVVVTSIAETTEGGIPVTSFSISCVYPTAEEVVPVEPVPETDPTTDEDFIL